MKIKSITIFLFIIITISTTSIAYSINEAKQLTSSNKNSLEVTWQYNYGDELTDYAMDVLETNDGGFITVGRYSESSEISKGWVIKTHSDGTIDWDEKYGKTDTNYFRKILKTNNGYIIGGSSNSELSNSRDFWVVKIYEDGTVDWQEKYDQSNSLDLFTDITKTSDNCYVLLGSTLAGEDYGSPLLIKIDDRGIEQKRTIYDRYLDDNTEDTHLFDIDLTNDGGFICVGYIQKKDISDYDFFILKLDKNLKEEWNNTFDSGSDLDWCYSICETNNGYVLTGEYYYEELGKPHIGLWVVKTDSYGQYLKNMKYKGINKHASGFFIEQLENGNFIITGKTGDQYDEDYSDLLVLEINQNLEEVCSKNLGGAYDDDGKAVRQTNDNGFVVVGAKNGDDTAQDLWILKLNYVTNEFKPDTPVGETSGLTGTKYRYTTSVVHPEGLDIKFGWDWNGDEEVDEWTEEFYSSGQTAEIYHKWSDDGFYLVHVKAKDIKELESEWSDPLRVSMPKARVIQPNILIYIFERICQYPLIKQILNL